MVVFGPTGEDFYDVLFGGEVMVFADGADDFAFVGCVADVAVAESDAGAGADYDFPFPAVGDGSGGHGVSFRVGLLGVVGVSVHECISRWLVISVVFGG